MGKNRLYEFDVIRGVCAVMIMLYHYTSLYEELIGPHQGFWIRLPWGNMAVSVFFLLSGFFTLFALKKEENIFSFAYKKIIRLYPAYWSAICLTILFSALISGRFTYTLPQILINLTMLQGFFNIAYVDGAHWFLQIEILFYALFGFFFLLLKIKNLNRACFAWLIVDTVFTVLKLYLPETRLLSAMALLALNNFSHMYIAGMALYQIWCDHRKKTPYFLLCLAVIKHYPGYGFYYTVFFAAALALMLGILLYRCPGHQEQPGYPPKIYRPLLFLGSISYPLYLLHQVIGFGILRFLEDRGLTGQIYMLIPVAVSIVLACFVHHLIENPSGWFLASKNPFVKQENTGIS